MSEIELLKKEIEELEEEIEDYEFKFKTKGE